MKNIRFLQAGDAALVIEFGSEIVPEINRQVTFLTRALDEAALPGVRDLIPTYRSVLVNFDPRAISREALQDFARRAMEAYSPEAADAAGEVVEIPVLYGGDAGPDLAFIAEHTGLAPEEVIHRHSGPEYLVYMLGFTPGFAYLGGLPPRLATPRLAKPRTAIPAGSVGIAAAQTGIYPVESPGGWQLLGRTPVKIFDYERENPFLVTAGNYLKFVPITAAEYGAIEEAGDGYQPRRYQRGA